jgi:two-component system response regulator DevR
MSRTVHPSRLAPDTVVPLGSRPIDVLLVDDHAVVRAGLKQLFISEADIRVVGEAATESEAIAEALRTHPDVIVMDVRLAGGDGVSATRGIRARLPDTKVIILTSFADDDALTGSIDAGASGFLLKGLRSGEIVSSVRAAARGEILFDADAVRGAAERVRKGKHLSGDRLARLSPQEERILEQVARGLTNREIADHLDLAEKTVKNYVSNVLLKLGVDRRAEAAAYFTRHTVAQG